jgi:hypothetical protein
MTNTILPQDDIHTELVSSLVDNGWTGKWELKGDKIILFNTHGTLHDKKKHLDYHQGLQLAMCLAVQLAALVSINKGVLFFSDKDITILDDEWFLLTNLDNIVPIVNNNTIMLSQPISFHGFLSPEIKNISELPFKTNISCGYYSLALMVIDALGINPSLDQIAESKLYYFLNRCLQENPDNRFILFI